MDDNSLSAGDQLLEAWLSLTSTLWNTRIVTSMTYNEAHVLGILLRHQGDCPLTATSLIARTHLLKSQMNKLLTQLEGKGFITRTRSCEDKRVIEIRMTRAGKIAYLEEHKGVEAILHELLSRIGADKAVSVAADLNAIVRELDDIFSACPGAANNA